MKSNRTHRWMALVCCAVVSGGALASEGQSSDRKLNPYHKQQLQAEIQRAESEVLACKGDADSRCLRQQELCQKLIQADRLDDALRVARNIYQTPNTNPERRAAHHYLIAEIYSRKMDASLNMQEMERNRQLAIADAQDVIRQHYSASWGVTDHARALIRQLEDPSRMAEVRGRVQARQGGGENAKEAMARKQRAYLDATHGRSTVAYSSPVDEVRRGFSELKHSSGKLIGSLAGSRVSDAVPTVISPVNYAARPLGSYTPGATMSARNTGFGFKSAASLPSSPQVSRSLSTVNLGGGGQITFSQAAGAAGLKNDADSSVRQVSNSSSGQAPVMVDGAVISRVESPTVSRTLPKNLNLGIPSQGTMFGGQDDNSSVGPGTYAAGQMPGK